MTTEAIAPGAETSPPATDDPPPTTGTDAPPLDDPLPRDVIPAFATEGCRAFGFRAPEPTPPVACRPPGRPSCSVGPWHAAYFDEDVLIAEETVERASNNPFGVDITGVAYDLENLLGAAPASTAYGYSSTVGIRM